MKHVASRLQPAQAQMMAVYLNQKGIVATVVGEAASLGKAGLYADLWVMADEDFDLARTLLEDYERRALEEDPDPPADWRCPSCGETLEGVFEACWQCGAERGEESGS